MLLITHKYFVHVNVISFFLYKLDEPDAHVTLCSKSQRKDFSELFWEIFRARGYTQPSAPADVDVVFVFELISPEYVSHKAHDHYHTSTYALTRMHSHTQIHTRSAHSCVEKTKQNTHDHAIDTSTRIFKCTHTPHAHTQALAV